MIRLLVCGSRWFDDAMIFNTRMDFLFDMYRLNRYIKDMEIVTGNDEGACDLACRYANQREIKLVECAIDWDKFGRSAAYRRNEHMVKYCLKAEHKLCVAFWDSKTPETKNILDFAYKMKMPIKIINI